MPGFERPLLFAAVALVAVTASLDHAPHHESLHERPRAGGFELTGHRPSATDTTIRLQRSSLIVDRLCIDRYGVPWSFVEVRYPATRWTQDHALAWGKPGTTLALGDSGVPLSLSSGSFVGTGSDGGYGFDTSEEPGAEALTVRFRGPDDFPDDPEISVETAPRTDSDRPPEFNAGSSLDFVHETLEKPVAELRAILRATSAQPVRDEDGDLVVRAELTIEFGPHRLHSPLTISLPDEVPSRSGTRVQESVLRAIEAGRSFEFLALDEADEPPADVNFHGFRALAVREFRDDELRTRVAETLARAALLGPTWSVDCFVPELGMRIRDPQLGDLDLLVSASCSALVVRKPGTDDVHSSAHLDETITAELIALVDAACGFDR